MERFQGFALQGNRRSVVAEPCSRTIPGRSELENSVFFPDIGIILKGTLTIDVLFAT